MYLQSFLCLSHSTPLKPVNSKYFLYPEFERYKNLSLSLSLSLSLPFSPLIILRKLRYRDVDLPNEIDLSLLLPLAYQETCVAAVNHRDENI